MDVSALAAIGAAGIGVIAGMAWLTLPRSEDYFERSMAELLDLTSGSNRVSPSGSESGGRDVQASLDVAPVPSVSSLHRGLPGDAATGPAAGVHSGGRASFIHPVESGDVTVSHRRRPVLFRVK